MPRAETREAIESYLSSQDARGYFSDDAEFSFAGLTEPARGPEAIARVLHLFYQEAFTETGAEVKRLVVDEDAAVAEFEFTGKHTGELNGIAPTNNSVRIPMIAVYEVADKKITSARLYYDTAEMAAQLGGG